MGPSRFGSAGRSRVLVRERGAGRGLRDGGVGVRARLADGRRRHRQAARLLPERLHRRSRTGSSSSAARSSTRSRSRRATRRSTTSRPASTARRPTMIAFCTSFAGDQPAFVDSLRTLGNKTPIMNSWASDGAYWWSKNPKVTNFYFVTYAGAGREGSRPGRARVRGARWRRSARSTRRRPAASSPARTRSTRSPTRSRRTAARPTARSSRRRSRACQVQDARRPDHVHADVPQRHRAALPRHRGEQQRREGDRRAHHQGRRRTSTDERWRSTAEGQASHGACVSPGPTRSGPWASRARSRGFTRSRTSTSSSRPTRCWA